jgi:pimeloyl-ACP methyl ester carboxylesterase
LVGAAGFEPAAPCAQGRCATRLRYAPTLKLLNSTLLFRACDGTRLVTLKDGGHFAYLDCPGATRQAIDDFFASVGRRRD